MNTHKAQLTVRDGHTKEVTHHPVTVEGQLTHATAMQIVMNHNGDAWDADEFAEAEREGEDVYFDPYAVVMVDSNRARIEDQSGTMYTIVII